MALRINDDEAKRLGIADHIPKRVTKPGKNEKGQNKTEAKFDRRLADDKHAGLILDYWFEGVKFRLADNTFLTPDFVVAMPDGSMIVYEVKGGFTREDARVKIKVAADRYPFLRWVVAKYVNREWQYELIGGRGYVA